MVARSADMFGVIIASSSPAVASRCAHARAGVGAVATQNITDPSLGARILDSLASGLSTDQALAEAIQSSPYAAYRQLMVLSAKGSAAIHSGTHALGTVGSACGAHCAAAGNLLADTDVPASMVEAFESATGPFGERLMAALGAGVARGGEAGPIHSAGLLIVRELSWPIVDLRVDWTDAEPVAALADIWTRYAPQIEDYVRRAQDPSAAPNFGVPGDL